MTATELAKSMLKPALRALAEAESARTGEYLEPRIPKAGLASFITYARTLPTLPKSVKYDSRICFAIAYFATEAEADIYGAYVRRKGYTYNGGFYHGYPLGRDKSWDYEDPKLGKLFAVTT